MNKNSDLLLNCRLSKFLPLLQWLVVAIPLPSYGITLDNFTDYKVNVPVGLIVTSKDTGKLNDSMVQFNAAAVGSTRSVELSTVLNQVNGGFVYTGFSNNFGNPNSIEQNSSLDGTAKTFLSYDGDNKVGLTNFTGLNLDLREGNADKLEFDVHYDLPYQNPMKLEFTFYDRSDPTGNTFSRGLYDVGIRSQGRDFTTLNLSFAALSIFGSNGAANLSNIGAFSILFDGSNAPAADFGFSNFRTNGQNTSVPEPITLGLLGSGLIGVVLRKKREAI